MGVSCRRISSFAAFFLLTVTLQSQVSFASVGGNINVSKNVGSQSEQAIGINPANPLNLLILSNLDSAGSGLFKAYSTDGGATWTKKIIADGSDTLIPACCDPGIAFDKYGNCFISYLDAATPSNAVIALSTDGGVTFSPLKSFPAADQPHITVGPDSASPNSTVWLCYQDSSLAATVSLSGALVSGLGVVGPFSSQVAPGSASCNFGDVAVSPTGGVMVCYQDNNGAASGPENFYVNFDPDGLGAAPLGARITVGSVNMGDFQLIPAQATRSVDSEFKLAWDRCVTSANKGRVYMSFTDMVGVSDTNIFVIHSDDNGTTWSPRVRVNDDGGTASQFLPRIALDQTTGNVALCWYDCRNDLGNNGFGDTNGVKNDDAQQWASFSTDGGVTFAPNFEVSQGTSNANDSPWVNIKQFDFGDFNGLCFDSGNFYPCWADNSNSTGDNPNGSLTGLNIYTAKCQPITGGGSPPIITNPNNVTGNVGVPFTFPINAIGSGPITFTITGALPPGLTFSGTTIAGNPTAVGVYVVTVTATNAVGSSVQTLTITIKPPLLPIFTSPPFINVFVNQPFQVPLSATGSQPITYQVAGLPAGVSFQLGYLIAGSIAIPGTYTVTVTATNPAGTTIQILTITVTGLPADGDADGDGIPNGLEQTLGSDPLNAASTPFVSNQLALASPRNFFFKKMDIKKRGGGKDTLSLSGSVPIATQGYKVDREQFLSLTLNVIQRITLQSSGSGTATNNGKAKANVSKQKSSVGTQNAQFSVSMQGDYTSAFTTAGFDGKTDVTMTVYVLFNRTVYSQSIKYSGVTHKCSLAP